jgi:hypothetical protein
VLLHYIIALLIAALAILIAIILGDYGPWYLSWFLGTGFMVLVASAAGVLFEAQEDAAKGAGGDVVRVVAEAAEKDSDGGQRSAP